MNARIDHLVVVAATLDEGVAWCESTLGITPGPGGSHTFMGTHNRLFRIATVNHPRAYFEIISAEPGKAPQPGRRRWFDMDDARLQARVKTQGPTLAHFVVHVPDAARAVQALRDLGIERGEVIAASRETPRGTLSWRITLRPDGERLFDGCLPALIEWGDTHPAASMADSGVTLHDLCITHPRASELRAACEAIGLEGIAVSEGPPNLSALLQTPRGAVRLESAGT